MPAHSTDAALPPPSPEPIPPPPPPDPVLPRPESLPPDRGGLPPPVERSGNAIRPAASSTRNAFTQPACCSPPLASRKPNASHTRRPAAVRLGKLSAAIKAATRNAPASEVRVSRMQCCWYMHCLCHALESVSRKKLCAQGRLRQRAVHKTPGSRHRPQEFAAFAAKRDFSRVSPGSPCRRSAGAAAPLYKEDL